MKALYARLFLGIMFLAMPVGSRVSADMSLPAESDPFWSVASQLHDPNDPTCYDKALTVYGALYGPGASNVAQGVCAGLSQVTSLDDTLLAQSINTNLFEDNDANGVFDKDWRSVSDLYFEMPTYGKIEFSQPINFMSFDFLTFISQLATRMDMEKDYIALDADIIDGLNGYGATLTMYNVSNFEEPEILVNGGDDTGNVVSGLIYNQDTDTITFSAQHFSNFQAVEKSSQRASVKSWSAERYKKTGASCEDRLKVTVKGKHFDKNAEVRIGSKKAHSVKRKSSRELVASFCYTDLLQIETDKIRNVSVANPNTDRKKADKKINILSYLKKMMKVQK